MLLPSSHALLRATTGGGATTIAPAPAVRRLTLALGARFRLRLVAIRHGRGSVRRLPLALGKQGDEAEGKCLISPWADRLADPDRTGSAQLFRVEIRDRTPAGGPRELPGW